MMGQILVVAIVQARMGSTRLPGKALMDIGGHPMLWHVVDRVKKCKLVDKIVLAVPEKDAILLKLAEEWGIDSFGGSEEDVLDRYYQAARKFNADPIVRITGDCPLINPRVIDGVINFYLDEENEEDFDYVRTDYIFPDGFEVEVFSFSALEKTWREARLPLDREHVTIYMTESEQFKFHLFRPVRLLPKYSVDTEKDLAFIREIYEAVSKVI